MLSGGWCRPLPTSVGRTLDINTVHLTRNLITLFAYQLLMCLPGHTMDFQLIHTHCLLCTQQCFLLGYDTQSSVNKWTHNHARIYSCDFGQSHDLYAYMELRLTMVHMGQCPASMTLGSCAMKLHHNTGTTLQSVSSVPRPFPAFKCCMLNSRRAWYEKSHDFESQ